MVQIELLNVWKRFGDVVASKDVSLSINDGEFFTLLGPSGCGKTTTMRMIAGLEYPDSGTVRFDGRDVTQLPSYRRNTGMVFQNYALWPHMTVEENISYGLEIRKIQKPEIIKRVDSILDLVKLGGMGKRYPTQLSGGQQQRVALARVLVINPAVLLLDEPLSNLDAKLRVEMREEIKDLQKRLKITTVYVTHDQEEAMTISDKVAIQDKGAIKQVGTPKEIYHNPEDVFIATFIGKGTILPGTVKKNQNEIEVSIGPLRISGYSKKTLSQDDRVACVFRPESFSIEEPKEPSNKFEGVVEMSTFIGPHIEVKLKINDYNVIINVPANLNLSEGDPLTAYIPIKNTIILPSEVKD